MTRRELVPHLRALADALPAGTAVPVPREWLIELLREPPASVHGEPAEPADGAVDWTVAQVARRIGLAKSTVRLMCQEGTLAGAYRPKGGKLWRVPVAGVMSWQDAQRERAGVGGDLGAWRSRTV